MHSKPNLQGSSEMMKQDKSQEDEDTGYTQAVCCSEMAANMINYIEVCENEIKKFIRTGMHDVKDEFAYEIFALLERISQATIICMKVEHDYGVYAVEALGLQMVQQHGAHYDDEGQSVLETAKEMAVKSAACIETFRESLRIYVRTYRDIKDKRIGDVINDAAMAAGKITYVVELLHKLVSSYENNIFTSCAVCGESTATEHAQWCASCSKHG